MQEKQSPNIKSGHFKRTNSFTGSETSVNVNPNNLNTVTAKANWNANTYTLTYNNQSGSGCSSKTGIYGSTWGTLCTPSRAASGYITYSFGGWFTGTSGSGTQITASSTVTGDQTVYAKWNSTNTCSGKVLADGKCWYMRSGSWNYSTAQSQCPSGYSAATKSQMNTLVSKYSGGGLYSALGLSSNGRFWSSTVYIYSGAAYILYVDSSDSFVNYLSQGVSFGVACIK